MTHDGPHLVERMIEFFYSGCYDEYPHPDLTHPSPFKLHLEMYSLADKYDIPKLGKLAIDYFRDALDIDDSAIATDDRKQVGYLSWVRAVYESTPDSNTGLRRAIVEHVVNCDSGDEGIMSNPRMKATFVEVPQFGWDCFSYSRGSL